jgi:hypothetical protein
MAISPNMLNEKLKNEASIIEKKLDHLLSNSHFSPGGSSISISIPSGMTRNHFLILKQRYLDAGWKDLSWRSEQRDGEWLEFKA